MPAGAAGKHHRERDEPPAGTKQGRGTEKQKTEPWRPEKRASSRQSAPRASPLYGTGWVEGRRVRVMPYEGHSCRECCFYRQQMLESHCPLRYCMPHHMADHESVYFMEAAGQ